MIFKITPRKLMNAIGRTGRESFSSAQAWQETGDRPMTDQVVRAINIGAVTSFVTDNEGAQTSYNTEETVMQSQNANFISVSKTPNGILEKHTAKTRKRSTQRSIHEQRILLVQVKQCIYKLYYVTHTYTSNHC